MTKASAKAHVASTIAQSSAVALELVTPVSSLVGLRAAVDNGADCVHMHYRDKEHASKLSSVNFDRSFLGQGIRYARDRGCKVILALNTATAQGDEWRKWRTTIDRAARSGIDALQLNEPALLLYSAAHYPQLPLHYQPHASAVNPRGLDMMRRQFGVARVVLPRVLAMAQLARISTGKRMVELQVCGFGRACSIVEGRDASRAALDLSDAHTKGDDAAGALPRCAGSEDAVNDIWYAQQRMPGVGILRLLPKLNAMGVSALTIEAEVESPAHQAQVTRVWREAIDSCLENVEHYSVRPAWIFALNNAARRFRSF
jgi:collagenase-like PrtC family protease